MIGIRELWRVGLLTSLGLPLWAGEPTPTVPLQTRVLGKDARGCAEWQVKIEPRAFIPTRSAFVICDMWDTHWSRGASLRVDAMAPEMNRLLESARQAGVIIIHAPSETMPFYAEHPARIRAQGVRRVQWPALAAHDDPPLPVDAADGGSDTGETRTFRAWTRQHPALVIDGERDYISDDGQEIWSILRRHEIDQVFLLGVHTNMCCLNRTFAIKSLVRRGQKVALVRDMTDAMYNPARAPYVSHVQGTQLIIEYIEKFWCPSITSGELSRAMPGPK